MFSVRLRFYYATTAQLEMMTADGTGGESPGQPQRDAENSQGKNIDKIIIIIKKALKKTLCEVFEGGGKGLFLGHLEGHIKKIFIPAYKRNHNGF